MYSSNFSFSNPVSTLLISKQLLVLGLTLEDDYVRPDCLIREKTEMSKLNPGSVCHLFETKATLGMLLLYPFTISSLICSFVSAVSQSRLQTMG